MCACLDTGIVSRQHFAIHFWIRLLFHLYYYFASVQVRVCEESLALQKLFSEIVDIAYDIIEKEQISVGQFTARLTNLPLEHQQMHREFLEEISAKITKDSSYRA